MLLVSASGSSSSINEKVLEKFEDHLKEQNTGYEILKLKEYADVPLLIDKKDIPERILELHKRISGHRYMVIFSPEHNGYFSAFFKNILDWISLIEVPFLKDTKVIVVSVSNTDRTVRRMEDGVKNTIKMFTNEPVDFINFNKYEEADQAKLINLFKRIHDLFI